MVRNKEQIKKVQTYRMTLSDDKTHRQLWTLRFSRMGLFLTVASSLFVLIAIVFSAIAFTPGRASAYAMSKGYYFTESAASTAFIIRLSFLLPFTAFQVTALTLALALPLPTYESLS